MGQLVCSPCPQQTQRLEGWRGAHTHQLGVNPSSQHGPGCGELAVFAAALFPSEMMFSPQKVEKKCHRSTSVSQGNNFWGSLCGCGSCCVPCLNCSVWRWETPSWVRVDLQGLDVRGAVLVPGPKGKAALWREKQASPPGDTAPRALLALVSQRQ